MHSWSSIGKEFYHEELYHGADSHSWSSVYMELYHNSDGTFLVLGTGAVRCGAVQASLASHTQYRNIY